MSVQLPAKKHHGTNPQCSILKGNVGLSCWPSDKRIHLPMQKTQVQYLVWEDPTCSGTTNKHTHHNYRACAPEPGSHNNWAHVLQLLKPVHLEPMLGNWRSHYNREACASQRRVAPPLTTTREKPVQQ